MKDNIANLEAEIYKTVNEFHAQLKEHEKTMFKMQSATKNCEEELKKYMKKY